MLKLFAAVLGGRAERCHIELHDVVFVVSESIENAYPMLVNKWFGVTKRLHLDSYIELNSVDGYDILIRNEKPQSSKKLFYVNFGAYRKDYFGEIHESKFYIAVSKSEVLMRAKKELCLNDVEPHCDDNIAIDDIIETNKIDQYYLHFNPSKQSKLNIISNYQRLDLPDILNQAVSIKNKNEIHY